MTTNGHFYYELCALRRCVELQRALADYIDKCNPGDEYASLMVREDIEKLCALLNRLDQLRTVK